jgi:ADP-L-glycero-D-manno-heptose 6-epimerase
MASMVYHSYHQIKENGKVKLFKSYKYEYKDGGQLRDFIYVKDVVEIIFWMLNSMLDSNWDSGKNGLYNVGTGKTESFLNLANYVFKAMQLEPSIEFINMPTDIHSKYQYYTKANNMKLFLAGYEKQFTSLEDGIKDYVVNYLQKNH